MLAVGPAEGGSENFRGGVIMLKATGMVRLDCIKQLQKQAKLDQVISRR